MAKTAALPTWDLDDFYDDLNSKEIAITKSAMLANRAYCLFKIKDGHMSDPALEQCVFILREARWIEFVLANGYYFECEVMESTEDDTTQRFLS